MKQERKKETREESIGIVWEPLPRVNFYLSEIGVFVLVCSVQVV